MFAETVRGMKAGDVSPVLRSAAGFHIVKLIERRSRNEPALVDQTHVRHILIRVNEITSEAEGKAKIDRLKDRLDGGAKFEDMAKLNSEDASSVKGGDLGWINKGDKRELDPAPRVVRGRDKAQPRRGEPHCEALALQFALKKTHGGLTLRDDLLVFRRPEEIGEAQERPGEDLKTRIAERRGDLARVLAVRDRSGEIAPQGEEVGEEGQDGPQAPLVAERARETLGRRDHLVATALLQLDRFGDDAGLLQVGLDALLRRGPLRGSLARSLRRRGFVGRGLLVGRHLGRGLGRLAGTAGRRRGPLQLFRRRSRTWNASGSRSTRVACRRTST